MKISHKTRAITSSDNHNISWDKLWEISERYIGDEPLSGDWSTELEHEQRAISEELGVSMDEAKHLMIDHLEIPEDAFNHPLAASTKVEKVESADNIEPESNKDTSEDMDLDEILPEEIDIDRTELIEHEDPYTKKLIDAVVDKLYELREDLNVQVDSDEKSLYFTLTTTDDLGYADIIVYEVPRDDLVNDIIDDVKYILGEMSTIDEDLK